ncbi:hypothetical protein LWX53_00260 [bacterium]|nr:hypothetical protein [bacterium]
MTIAAPSWQVPGTWLENLDALADIDWVRGVELLFFSYDREARRDFAAERDRIAACVDRFSFSLHLPDPLSPEALDLVAETEAFVGLYVFHPYSAEAGAGDAGSGAIGGIEEWARTVEKLCDLYGEARFAMEYTGASAFARGLERLSRARRAPAICADTGRLALDGADPAAWIQNRATSIAELHLHAARGGKDHFPLGAEDLWLPAVAAEAAARNWRVVLETFSLERTRASYDCLERWLR